MSPARRTAKKSGSARVVTGRCGRSLRPRARRTGRQTPLMNTDFKVRARHLQWQRLAAPLIALGLAAGLTLTSLRTDIVRMQYALATAGAQEQELLDQQRRLTVAHRNLLDPSRLGRIAKQRGFARPERVIDLRDRPRIEVAARAARP